jgi:hypothetical protein
MALAKTIAAYKGLWKQQGQAEVAPVEPAASMKPKQVDNAVAWPSNDARHHAAASEKLQDVNDVVASASPLAQPGPRESAEQLAHRYRMLVLREHRYKLGRDLLELGHRDPWAVAWSMTSSFGRGFRPWAHARLFALGCYLSVEMSPEFLRHLRHPLWIGRYQRSMFGLWRLLEILAQKTGQKPGSRLVFRLFYLCPPLGVLIYERQLQSVLRKAQGRNAVPAQVLANAPQGQ